MAADHRVNECSLAPTQIISQLYLSGAQISPIDKSFYRNEHKNGIANNMMNTTGNIEWHEQAADWTCAIPR